MVSRWSSEHQRMHLKLLRIPELLPQGEKLLLAVSGGQDSMAMLGLLNDLKKFHEWELQIWHGNHNIRPNATQQSSDISTWAKQQSLAITVENWPMPQANEEAAREWRYQCLKKVANKMAINYVLTAHTANDRAETLLLHAARGCHRNGLGSLKEKRALDKKIKLIRPMLMYKREDTMKICKNLNLPVWEDCSNNSPCFTRNRIRNEVIPILEELHPKSTIRLASLSKSMEDEYEHQEELVKLALSSLTPENWQDQLNLAKLTKLSRVNQKLLVQAWLKINRKATLPRKALEELITRINNGTNNRMIDFKNITIIIKNNWIQLITKKH